ncbi:ribose 5-phosphate isomerase B [Micropruina sonneratiae]|uniref:ribose 5-phosphate isomerase B n=1 Tax=Micropruina sonneratiae TaxID=2986940 RepID=UPI002225F8DE|nr:ribose 5-phosphate isomerase B [Micropruina sp. KQZ13P-5]MCW3158137.1 ribose 5-phosphate isomerase B [Micropruina sp. KQZ13P-5]
MRIVAHSDHAGVALRLEMVEQARELGHEVDDLGPAVGEKVDYPYAGAVVGHKVSAGEYDLGILVCGTGVGISMAANKIPGARAVVCSEPYTARLSRQHNASNIVAVGERVVGPGEARMIVEAFLTTEPAGGRHAQRVEMLKALDNQNLALEDLRRMGPACTG